MNAKWLMRLGVICFLSFAVLWGCSSKEETSDGAVASTDSKAPTAGDTGTLTASSVTSTGMTISWTAATDETSTADNLSYQLFYSTTNNLDSVANIEANGTTVLDNYTVATTTASVTGLSASTTYYFNVIVQDEKNNKGTYSVLSQATSASGSGTTTDTTTAAPSSAPTLTATAGVSQVSLSWTAVTGASSYTIYWKNSSGVTTGDTAITGETGTSYTHSSLTYGSTYYYSIVAVNSGGSSSLSSEVSATPSGIMGGSIQTGTALSLNADVTTFDNSSSINSPFGLATDGTNLYVADYFTGHKIQQIVLSTGAVTTLAGSGSSGASDGTGTAATFNRPQALTTPDGVNLYVVEQYNSAVRKIVISSGVVTTFAGSMTASGTTDGTGTAARFGSSVSGGPSGITSDTENLYVADTTNDLIRKIVISSGVVTTLAGDGTAATTDGTGTAASFDGPTGITTDGTNLYVGEGYNGCTIRKVVISTGVVTTIAGSSCYSSDLDATGTSAKFGSIYALATDGTNLYTAGGDHRNIRKIVISSGVVTTFAGSTSNVSGYTNGNGTSALFKFPRGITTDGTSLYVGDYSDDSIRKID